MSQAKIHLGMRGTQRFLSRETQALQAATTTFKISVPNHNVATWPEATDVIEVFG